MVAQSTWQHPQLSALERSRALKQFYCLHPVVFGVGGNIVDLSVSNTTLAFYWLRNGCIGCSNWHRYFGTFARARDAVTFSLRYRTSI